jgi:hypothetical protein
MLRTSSRFDLRKKKKKKKNHRNWPQIDRSIYCGNQQNRVFQKGETREAQKSEQEAARTRNKSTNAASERELKRRERRSEAKGAGRRAGGSIIFQ